MTFPNAVNKFSDVTSFTIVARRDNVLKELLISILENIIFPVEILKIASDLYFKDLLQSQNSYFVIGYLLSLSEARVGAMLAGTSYTRHNTGPSL